jgi:hypothetical protein
MSFRILIAAVFAAGLLLAPPAPAAAQEGSLFISVLDDLPLMPGLVEDTESGTVFDTAQGRIVEAFATGALPKSRVLAFYDETLPQLGWRRVASGVFQREGETLSLEFPPEADSRPGLRPGSTPVLTVGFRLMPSGG